MSAPKSPTQRTKEALTAVTATGKPLGRPRGALGKSTLDGKKEEIKTLLALRVSKAPIAKVTGVDRATLSHFGPPGAKWHARYGKPGIMIYLSEASDK
jgi:DNA invertase Pin-like site-specific DNA recombinase